MGHSKIPWKTSGTTTQSTKDPIFHYANIVSGGKRVARVAGIGRDEALANAQFIVKACNAHEELVGACKDVLQIKINQYKNLPTVVRDGLERLLEVIAALED